MPDPTDPPVTDHAVIRYLERGCGMDIEGIRKFIADKCRDTLRAGAARMTIGEIIFEFDGGRVVTVTPKTSKHPSHTRAAKLLRGPK